MVIAGKIPNGNKETPRKIVIVNRSLIRIDFSFRRTFETRKAIIEKAIQDKRIDSKLTVKSISTLIGAKKRKTRIDRASAVIAAKPRKNIINQPINSLIDFLIEINSLEGARICQIKETGEDLFKSPSLKNFVICTASGEVSWELKGYLTGMGVLDCFDRLYGPDLINRMKASKSYYQRILDDMHLHPSEVIVLDDSSDYLSWASELGITTIHVDYLNGCKKESCHYHIRSLNDIRRIILE